MCVIKCDFYAQPCGQGFLRAQAPSPARVRFRFQAIVMGSEAKNLLFHWLFLFSRLYAEG